MVAVARFSVGSGTGGSSRGKGGCGGAVMGVLIGIIMIPVGFYLAYYGEAKLVDHSRVFDGVEMVQPDAAMAMGGELVKFSGQPEGEFLDIPEWQGDALYWVSRVEEYVREEDSEGDVSYRWNSVSNSPNWVNSFEVPPVTVRPGGAHPVGRQEVYSAYKRSFETGFHTHTEPGSPEVGDQRKTIEVLDARNQVIVLGQMSNGTVESGRSFIVSTLNEQQTYDTLRSEYVAAYWGIKAGAVFLIFFGIMSVFGPLTRLVGYIPMVGEGISCAFAAVAFVFAVVSVTVITVFMKAFWFLVVLAMLAVIFLIIRGVTTPRSRPGDGDPTAPPPGGPYPPEGPAPPASPGVEPDPAVAAPPPPSAAVPRPAETEAPTPSEEPQESASSGSKFCANCGEGLDPGSKFCASCGRAVEGS